MIHTTRRHFLKVIGAGGACLATRSLAGCSDGDSTQTATGDFDAGNESAIAVGTLQALGSNAVCIGRDSGGFYAMTLTCTHEGCNIAEDGSVSAAGITCSCHGSRFDANGNVLSGPASSPLRHFLVTADASGELTVQTGTVVDANTRLAAS